MTSHKDMMAAMQKQPSKASLDKQQSASKLSLRAAGKLVAASNQISGDILASHCTAAGPGLTGFIAQQAWIKALGNMVHAWCMD